MHYISKIEVKNFKSIENCTFHLSHYTPLVGYNNAGKSNIIKALSWFVKPYKLEQNAFYNTNDKVEIIGTIEGITQAILNQLTPTNQTKIKKFLFFNKLVFKRIQENPTCGLKDIKLELLNYGYGYLPDQWETNPTGLAVALKELFPDVIEIGAMESAPDDTSKFKKSNTIGKLISEIIKPVEENHTLAINKKLETISKKFNSDGSNRLKELKKFDSESTAILENFFPGIEIKVHIPTPNIQDLFQNSMLKVVENANQRNLDEYGHGTQRSVQMALIKYLSDIQKNNKFTTTLVLLDEPELYLHPQAIEQIRIALKDLSIHGYQIVFSTHSPQMILSKDILNTLLIRKEVGRTFTRKRMQEAIGSTNITGTHKTQFELLMSLTNSNQLLFSEKVVLIEGTTELRLFPTLFEKKTKKTLGQQKIALIEQNSSSSTKKTLEVLQAMDLPAKAILDLDFAFRGAIKAGYLEAADINTFKTFLQHHKPPQMTLAPDGFPQQNGNMSAAQGFEWLASQPTMIPHIESIHQKLKNKNIWIWTKGAIEKHLNLNGKNEEAWIKFLDDFGKKSFGRYIKDSKVKEMFEWIIEA